MLVHTTHSMKHAEGGPRQQRSKTKLLGNIPLTKATRYTTQEQTLAVVVFQSSHTNQGQSWMGTPHSICCIAAVQGACMQLSTASHGWSWSDNMTAWLCGTWAVPVGTKQWPKTPRPNTQWLWGNTPEGG